MESLVVEVVVSIALLGMGVYLRSLSVSFRDLRRDHEAFFQRLVRLETGREETVRRLETIEEKLDLLIKSNERLSAWLEMQQKDHP